MYGILDRYIGKNVIFSVLLVSVCLTLFAGLISIIDHLRYIGRGTIDFLFVITYVAYKLPGILVQFFPVSILIGGVVGLGTMARNSEIIILQSIGLSKLQIGISCVKSLIPVIFVICLMGETVAPKLDKIAENEYYLRSSDDDTGIAFSSYADRIWLKEGNIFIGINSIIDNRTFILVRKFEYDGINLKSFSVASTGHFINNQWVMQNVTENTFENGRIIKKHYDTQIWSMSINVDRIEVLNDIDVVTNLSLLQLQDYINYIEENGVDSSRYKLYFYNKILSPIVMMVMLLLALSTIFGPLRSMNMGARILAGITLGFGYYVLNQIVAPFSIVYGVPPFIGATFATLVFVALAIYLLKRKT